VTQASDVKGSEFLGAADVEAAVADGGNVPTLAGDSLEPSQFGVPAGIRID
jgi:hypothetical protein